MKELLFSPPVTFAAFLIVCFIALRVLSAQAARGEQNERALDPYACGQRDFEHYVNPNYMQFFRYAFAFTVMHVLALVVASAPPDALALPLAYVAAGVLALVTIFRK